MKKPASSLRTSACLSEEAAAFSTVVGENQVMACPYASDSSHRQTVALKCFIGNNLYIFE